MKPFVLAVVSSLLAPAAVAFDAAFKTIDGSAWDVDTRPISYVMDPAGSDDVDGDGELQALRDAWRAWSCVPGAKVAAEDGGAGPREVNLDDGKNTLFWDETGDECGMGGGTLGITVAPVAAGTRSSADICFNGRDHTWGVGTNTDVQSIALHEIGHLLGLDHPCDSDDDLDSCLPLSQALMFPTWGNTLDREPRSSDVAGIVALYPLGEGEASSCTPPFAQGERCGCNDECLEGLQCAADPSGELRCSKPCSVNARDCGDSSVCIFDSADGTGLCIRTEGDRPAGAGCTLDNQCSSGDCGAVIQLGSSICKVACASDSDCGGGVCFEEVCLAASASQACEGAEDGGCGCTTSSPATPSSVALALGLLAILRRRRRA